MAAKIITGEVVAPGEFEVGMHSAILRGEFPGDPPIDMELPSVTIVAHEAC